jgi:hypothetical protein
MPTTESTSNCAPGTANCTGSLSLSRYLLEPWVGVASSERKSPLHGPRLLVCAASGASNLV